MKHNTTATESTNKQKALVRSTTASYRNNHQADGVRHGDREGVDTAEIAAKSEMQQISVLESRSTKGETPSAGDEDESTFTSGGSKPTVKGIQQERAVGGDGGATRWRGWRQGWRFYFIGTNLGARTTTAELLEKTPVTTSTMVSHRR
jgi:hypothetical protein